MLHITHHNGLMHPMRQVATGGKWSPSWRYRIKRMGCCAPAGQVQIGSAAQASLSLPAAFALPSSENFLQGAAVPLIWPLDEPGVHNHPHRVEKGPVSPGLLALDGSRSVAYSDHQARASSLCGRRAPSLSGTEQQASEMRIHVSSRCSNCLHTAVMVV